MKIRSTFSTEGKKVTFEIDDEYYVLGENAKKKVFDAFVDCKTKKKINSNFKYCVAYTEVKRDCGYHTETKWGSPCIEQYDNGNVGYQNFIFFNDKEKALQEYNNRKKLTPKVGTIAYVDVLFIKNI